jgi:hypothetical protein
MIGGLLLLILLWAFTIALLRGIQKKIKWLPVKLMIRLFWYHMFFAAIYYTFAQFSASDSVAYFHRPQTEYDSWIDVYATGTPFIDFISYPFINSLKFSYEMMMVLFAWMGYWGFVCFYIFFRENIAHRLRWKGANLVSLVIFLPNMHYWTASLGKGSIIFCGLGMIIFGLSRMSHRKIALIMGLLIVYHVRPHIFLFMALAIVAGLFTGRQNVPFYQKIIVLAGSAAALVLLYDKILGFVNLDTDNLLDSFDQFAATRSGELAKAGSGLDISKYPLPAKLFTFWFRPLFVDAPGPVGFIVSFENLLYVFLAIQLFRSGFIGFLRKSSALVKVCAVAFLATSFALSGTMSNLGIIMRQKSMVMYFFVFIVLSFMDYKKSIADRKRKKTIAKKTPIPVPAI